MSDQQKAIVSLIGASKSCKSALASLPARSAEHHADLALLHADFLSILALLHASATKVALSLKPSSPTYSASLMPLKDIADHVAALSHCVSQFDPDHGTTLQHEFTSLAKNVIESLSVLLQVYLTHEANDTRTHSGQAGDEYIVRTGVLHDLIDTARSSNGLSKDNVAAVRKKWSEVQGSLDDGLKEVGEMIEEAQSTVSGDEDEDDGWDELGLGSGKKMDQDELRRTQKVHTILRLSTLLHKRIRLDLLASSLESPSSVVRNNQLLDALPSLSSALLVASDDLVSTLYTPQNPADIFTELTSFQEVIRRWRPSILNFFPHVPLEEQMQDMNLAGKKDARKWLSTCFEQIDKTVQALIVELNTKT